MSRPPWCCGAGGRRWLAGLLCVLGMAACSPPPSSRPNVLLISLDTTRADHLGVYGRAAARTPYLDALAAEGFLFRRHMTPVPITLPAHASLMTGHYPPTHTVRDNGTFIVPPEAVTLAEVLSGEGYATAAFLGAFPLAARFGLDQGFEVYDADFESAAEDPARRDRGVYFDERPAGEVVDAAVEYFGRHEGRRPFFTFVHLFDPHQPQQPPAPYDVLFRASPYDGEIAYVDEQLGRLFDALKRRHLWHNTVVVVTADHGEGLGEHGELTHAMLLHQATLHIPLIVHGPGVPVGETRAWTSSTQVFGTLLDLLGISPPEVSPPRSHGLGSLMGGREGGGEGRRFTAYFETIAPRTSQGWSQLSGWMEGDWRLIHGPKPELYHLGDDPREMTNLAQAKPHIVAELFAELRRFLAANEVRSVGDSLQQIDSATMERLAALGYLQGDLEAVGGMSDLLDVEGLIHPRDRVVDISLFSDAKASMAKGHWMLAQTLWRQLLANNPDNVDAHRGLALLYGMTEDWDRSLDHIDQGLALRPGALDLLRLKGEIAVQRGRFREGLDLLLELPAEDPAALVWMGQALQGLERFDEAEETFRRGVDLEPDNRWMGLYLANQLAINGKYEEAEELYRSILEQAPYFHLAYYNYGTLLIDMGQPRRARGLLERSALLAPQHEPTAAALESLVLDPATMGRAGRTSGTTQ